MKLIFTILFILLTALAVSAQAKEPVTVSQGFLDDANKAFIELPALRKLVAAQDAELKAKDELIDTLKQSVELQKQALAIKDDEIKTLRALKCDQISFFWGAIKKKSCK